jgi:hypothetical protein
MSLDPNVAGDPTGGDTSGTQPTTANMPSGGNAPSAPAAPAPSAPAPSAPMAPQEYARALGRPLTLDELSSLAGGQKLHDQRSVDQIVRERLQRDRQSNEAIVNSLTQQYQARLAEMQRAQEGGASEQVLAPFIQAMQDTREQIEDINLDRELSRLAAKYPDFGPNEDTILRIALAERTSPETAYKAFKYEHITGIDVKALEKNAVDKYLRSKSTTSNGQPRIEGEGGSARVEANKHDGSFETAAARSKNLLKQVGG